VSPITLYHVLRITASSLDILQGLVAVTWACVLLQIFLIQRKGMREAVAEQAKQGKDLHTYIMTALDEEQRRMSGKEPWQE
jgi:hypothetical protein